MLHCKRIDLSEGPRHVPCMATSYDEIKETLELLDDWEERYKYIIEIGQSLPAFPDALKVPELKVRGCSSQVWIKADWSDDDRLTLTGDSDAHIVRGLMATLFELYDQKTAQEAAALDARAELEALGLSSALSPTRTNGLYAMVERIRALAQNQSAR